MDNRQQGGLAEELARSWLEHNGYRYIESNFHRRVGEIDLIFNHPRNGSIVFVEVRYRADQRFGGGIASVDWQKRRKLARTANAWLQRYASSTTPARIDVIALCPANGNTPADQLWQGHQLQWVKDAVQEE